jgi:cyclopropane fatty-acyl-phospholipid synthase-like methyltransferase
MNEPELELDRRRGEWDAYYHSLPLTAEDAPTREFNAEFVDRISALLPAGARVLEAGCGAGWQSVALARSARFDVSVMDFSARALDYSRRIFGREGLSGGSCFFRGARARLLKSRGAAFQEGHVGIRADVFHAPFRDAAPA